MKKYNICEEDEYYRENVFPKMNKKDLENMVLVLLYRLNKIKKYASIYLSKKDEVHIKRFAKAKEDVIKKF